MRELASTFASRRLDPKGILSPPPHGGGLKICDLDLILMRQGASSRIKIQFIEFLCDKI